MTDETVPRRVHLTIRVSRERPNLCRSDLWNTEMAGCVAFTFDGEDNPLCGAFGVNLDPAKEKRFRDYWWYQRCEPCLQAEAPPASESQ